MLIIESSLAQSDRALSEKYLLMKRRLLNIEYEHTAAGFPEGNNHGRGHIKRVLEYLNNLLGPNPLNHINSYELFLSMMSILYHDIGLLRQRQGHADISRELLEGDDQNAYVVNPRDRDIIAVAVANHSSSKDIETECSSMDDVEFIGGREARPKVISALVRFSDELDEDFRRADPILQQRLNIPPSSDFYWRFCQRVRGIRPSLETKHIDVNAGFEADDLSVLSSSGTRFVDFFAQKLEKLNKERMVVNRFLPPGLQYNSILISMKPIKNHPRWATPVKFRFEDHTTKIDFLHHYSALIEEHTNKDSGLLTVQVKNTEEARGQIKTENKEGRDELVKALVQHHLNTRLEEALVSFSSQPIVWVEPVLSRKNEAVRRLEASSESDDIISLTDIIEHPRSIVIKAPPQFGLTCLAHYLAKEAWSSKDLQFWLYLDSKNLRPYAQEIQKVATADLEKLSLEMKDVKCIVLDSWTAEAKDSSKLLDVVGKLFEGVPIVLMATMISDYLLEQPITSGGIEFEKAYLWSLSRNRVRSVVRNYNEEKHMGDEDTLTAKVVSDLEVLNIHRTPLNCMTLLKVAEVDFDDSPVNRTEMIKRVLFLLFNVDEIPTYKSRPDLKDCEFVLGYFVETLIRSGQYIFSREHFLKTLRQFCVDRVLDLEVEVVFDVLHRNNILVSCGGEFCFRFSYWIFYFAAQRMYHDQEFEAFILGDMRYITYPEIIEFYTGIDRRRQNALAILTEDIRKTADEVETKCGLPDGLNPYKFAVWTPSTNVVEQMQREITDGVLQSTLPAVVKDQYADRTYDRTRPYHQSIQTILREYSMAFMLQGMKAAGRALRNSDYVDPDAKRAL